MQPDITVAPGAATGAAQLQTSREGALRFVDAAGASQLLFAAFNEPAATQAVLQAMDAGATMSIQLDGTALVVLNGQRLTFTPDLTLGGIAPERAGQGWWQEGPNRYRVVNRQPAGTSQGFTVR